MAEQEGKGATEEIGRQSLSKFLLDHWRRPQSPGSGSRDLVPIPATIHVPSQTNWGWTAGKVALAAVGSVLAVVGAVSYPLAGLLVRPNLKRLFQLKRSHLRRLMKRLNFEFEDVVITSFDSIHLNGWWLKAGDDAATVVVLHGVTQNRTDVLRTALLLRGCGFNVLMFDGRGHGSSEGRYVTYGFYERRDVESALEWLVSEKKVDKSRIGLAGESMGAAIALQVAAKNDWLGGVWADSPFASLRRITAEYAQRTTRLPAVVLSPVLWTTLRVANYRGHFDVETIDPAALAAHIKCPVFLAHGNADQMISPAHSECIYAALAGKKELWIVEGARHARAVRHAKKEYGRRLVGFFTENLARPAVPNQEKPAALPA